jgi:ribose transport system permease protein
MTTEIPPNTAKTADRSGMATTAEVVPPSGSPQPRNKNIATSPKARRMLRQSGAILFFVAFFLIVGILKGSAFLSWSNFVLVASQNAYVAFVACGLTFALISGQFDLSCGALMGLTAMLAAGFGSKSGIPLVPVIALVLVVGALAGLINGLLVTRFKINAFIATLGTGSVFTGFAYLYNGPNAIFQGISPTLISVGTHHALGIGLPALTVPVLLVVAWAVSRQTILGRFFEAIGANPVSARLAGVPVRTYTLWAFIVTGIVVALGGILFVGTFGSIDPTSGPAVLLPAFSACFLGTTLVGGSGRFNIVGTIIAALLIAWAENALQVLGLSLGWNQIFDGGVLIAAVAVNQFFGTRKSSLL